MKNLDTYLSLCTQVYELSKPNPPEDAYAFYRDYVMKARGPVLEPMCGSGRFLIPLIEEGFDVHGFDASAHMLRSLHEKATMRNLKPNVWYGFAQDLQKSEKYDLIFIPSGSFCLITDEDEVYSVLRSFYHHLTDSGVLLFEVETIKTVPQLGVWRGSVWPKSDNTQIISSFLSTLSDGICRSLCKYELLCDNKVTQTEIEELRVKIYDHDNLIEMLEMCGFKTIRVIKAFDPEKSTSPHDESIVYECRK